ncbi:hypothetical protein LEMLEM_LOCUS15785 [Lemmus lemmus]
MWLPISRTVDAALNPQEACSCRGQRLMQRPTAAEKKKMATRTQGQHLHLADTTSECGGYCDGTCLDTIHQDDFNLDNGYGSPRQNIVPMSVGNSFGEHRFSP